VTGAGLPGCHRRSRAARTRVALSDAATVALGLRERVLHLGLSRGLPFTTCSALGTPPAHSSHRVQSPTRLLDECPLHHDRAGTIIDPTLGDFADSDETR
jgi:hypothetical protein